jgi:hypothetical protein
MSRAENGKILLGRRLKGFSRRKNLRLFQCFISGEVQMVERKGSISSVMRPPVGVWWFGILDAFVKD